MHISDEKERLRNSITERMHRMTDDERHAESRTLCRQLLPLIPKDTIVCGYFPLKSETDIRPLLLTILERGQDLYLPTFANMKLVYRKTEDLSNLPTGALNIPEPPKGTKELDRDAQNLVIIVPGRAFDASGRRLGRGAGGYDRWIKRQRQRNPSTKFIGVALECQLVKEVPVEEHDQNVDMVVTPREVIHCQENSNE